jgi:hypothetical protein
MPPAMPIRQTQSSTDSAPLLHGSYPRAAAYLVAVIVALSFSYDLMRKPIQVTDSFQELLDVQQSPSLYATFMAHTPRGPFLRPLKQVQTKILFDAANGHYWLVFRGFHALLLTALLLLFVRALRVRRWADFAAAVFALMVLTGLHTFRGTVREAFPINFYLENAVLCLVAFNLAQARAGWWIDVALAATFAVASMNAESGVLVWVVAAAAWACGMPGISRRSLAIVTLLLAAYMSLRFALSIGTPGLDVGRDSGFGIRLLEADELARTFAAHPIWFYSYNVFSQILSVLFSDPVRGVFHTVRTWMEGEAPIRLYLATVPSVVTTGLIVWAVNARLRGRAPSMPAASDQMFGVFLLVLLANAVVSYAYTKHEIVIVAGTFYAFAAFAAARHAIEHLSEPGSRTMQLAFCLMLGALAAVWSFRTVGVHYMMQTQAFREQLEWARLDPEKLAERSYRDDAQARALAAQIRRDALDLRLPNPRLMPGWANRWWDWWGD